MSTWRSGCRWLGYWLGAKITAQQDVWNAGTCSPLVPRVKIEQVIYFKNKNMLHNISKLSSGAVRSKFNILYDFHELEGLHPCGSERIHTMY